MEGWFKISLLLCVFGFLKEVRPSEPFIYDYLIGPWKNFTKEQVTQEMYPVGTYANMILLLIVFLITDMCRYKPLIVVLGLSGIAVWSMLLWTNSLFALQALEPPSAPKCSPSPAMEGWFKISLLLCVFGFLKEVRPSEPFIYDYLIGPWKNFTKEQVTQEMYPVGTYANMILLLIVFLITDMCRYKPLIVVLGLSGIAVWSMLLWTNSLFALQALEVFYGMFIAAEVAYYTYIYAKVDPEHYQKVTSHTRGAVLAGRAISGVSSQTLTSLDVMDYKELNYITFTAVSAATIWAIFLPPVERSIYFHSADSKELPFKQKLTSAFVLMRSHFWDAYTNITTLKWSIWWALSSCGYVQVENYMQPLYEEVQSSDEAAYNGAVEAILTLLGFVGALAAGYLKIDWTSKGEMTLAAFSVVQGILMVVASQTTEIFLCYSFYVIFGVLFHFMVTIASAQIAKNIDADSYGLIFGINSFVALVFNSILTASVATKGVGFHLPAREQYVVYGCYHMGIGLMFVITGLEKCLGGSRGVSALDTRP